MSTTAGTTAAAYFCVSGPQPYYCVGRGPQPYLCVGDPYSPPPDWPTYPTIPTWPQTPPHRDCGCPPFTPEAMPLDLMRKLVQAIERTHELERENAELRAEIAKLREAAP